MGDNKMEIDNKEATEVFNKLLKGENIEEVIETERGAFTIKYPLSNDWLRIIATRQRYLNGLDENSLSNEEKYKYHALSALDVCITKSPDWWTNAFAVSEVVPELVLELHRGFLLHSDKIRALCKEALVGKTNRERKLPNPTKTVGDNFLQNITK